MRLLILAPLVLSLTPLHATVPFAPIDTSFMTREHIVPGAPLQSKILMQSQTDIATNAQGQTAPVKEWLDFIGYVPIEGRSDSGYVISNNETDVISTVHGDGGGMTVFTAHFKDGTWDVADHPKGRFRSVDFGPVGGTIANCGGGITPWGTVLTGEEWSYTSNSSLYNNGNRFRDTTDWMIPVFNGQVVARNIKRFENMNWIVEVDVANAVALKKHYNMGRYAHEVGYPMPDGKTVYLTDDATPAAFFKFVSQDSGNYDVGQLYAYRQSSDGESGSWIPMPMQLDSMIDARAVAFRLGATAFTRHEWAVHHDGKLYITETGNDNSGTAHRNAVRMGATLPLHLSQRMNQDSSIIDRFGRILRLDLATHKMDVLLEGGPGNSGQHFSNPDGLTKVTLGDRTFLVIQEDLNGNTFGRMPAYAANAGRTVCEMYWLDLAVQNPTVDDLKRFMVGPHGAELTGARFTPDGRTMFVNVQHPSSGNPAPYNRSYTLAVWGYYGDPTGLIFDPPKFKRSDRLQVEVNAASRFAYFDRQTDVELFNAAGRRLEYRRNVRSIDIAFLSPGSYYLRFPGGESHKLVLQ